MPTANSTSAYPRLNAPAATGTAFSTHTHAASGRFLITVLALLSLGAESAAGVQWRTGPSTLFALPHDVSFTLSTDRKTYSAQTPITVKYRITNVSNRALYAPRRTSITCPAFPHVQAWFEDSSGRHTGTGYGGSCRPLTQTLSARLSKEAVLLEPGEHLDDSLDLPIANEMPPGAYRIEATLYGWSQLPGEFNALTDVWTRDRRSPAALCSSNSRVVASPTSSAPIPAARPSPARTTRTSRSPLGKQPPLGVLIP